MYKDIEKVRSYNRDYIKDKYQAIAFRLKRDSEADIIEYLAEIKGSGASVNDYIKQLIIKDMRGEK